MFCVSLLGSDTYATLHILFKDLVKLKGENRNIQLIILDSL